MKKFLLTAGLLAILATSGIALAAGETTQSVSGKATPSKLPEKGLAGVSLKFSETTGTTDPSGVQPATLGARILLDKDFSLRTRGLPRCGSGELADATTDEAKQACGDSLVGRGSALARISDGAGGHIDVPTKVTAFIGKPGPALPEAGGRPILVLHIVVAGLGASDVPLSIKKVDGAYGTELATFPGRDSQPIRKLTLTLHRSFTAHGKRQNFVSARCSHGELRYKGRFTYVGSPPLSATSTQRCTTRR